MGIQANKVTAALQQRGASGQCPSCGHNNWGVGDMPLMLNALDPDSGALMMGQGIQAILVGCNNCGLLRLHGTAALGL
jgi:hypothetical protein